MKLLLDTHTWVWVFEEPERLSETATRAIKDERNSLHLSPISSREVMMLTRKGRLVLEPSSAEWLSDALSKLATTTVPLSHAIAIRSEQLDGFGSADPGDRFLVATALEQDLVLVTADQRMHDYEPVQTLW